MDQTKQGGGIGAVFGGGLFSELTKVETAVVSCKHQGDAEGH